MNCPPMSSGQRMVRQPCRQAEELLSWACLLPTRGVSGANQGSARPGQQQPFTSNSQAQLGVLLRIFAELIPFPHGGAPRDGDGRITGTPPTKTRRRSGLQRLYGLDDGDRRHAQATRFSHRSLDGFGMHCDQRGRCLRVQPPAEKAHQSQPSVSSIATPGACIGEGADTSDPLFRPWNHGSTAKTKVSFPSGGLFSSGA